MATSSVDHVTFRWNDHVSYLSKLLSFQRVEEHYCDATIITDDCFVIKAHQAVLATTSGYFQKVLDGISSDQHPIIVLTGANFRELNCVLDYIYQGVTRVDQDMMESVLDIADMLEIKGLSKIKRNPSVKKSISLPQSLPSTSEILQGFISATPSPHLQSNEPLLDSQSTQPFIMSGNMHQQYSQNDSSNNQLCHSPFLNINDHQNTNCLKERCEDNTYVDQTSGIDLSLSRGGQMEKGFGRESLMQVEDEEESEQDNHNTMDETEHITNNSMSESELSNLTEIELRGERCPNRKNDYDSASVPLIKRINNCCEISSFQKSRITIEKIASILNKERTFLDNDDCNNKPMDMKRISSLNIDSNHGSFSEACKLSIDSHIEVLCSDGALTISVTTGPDSDSNPPLKQSEQTNNENLSSISLINYEKCQRLNFKSKKCFDDVDKNDVLSSFKRPNTRSLGKLRNISLHSDPVDVNFNSSSTECNLTESKGNQDIKRDDESNEKGNVPPSISPLSLFTLPPMKKTKQTRTALSLNEKIKVIESFLKGKSQRQIAHIHGIGKTQVSGIVKKREEILNFYRQNLVTGINCSKRSRKSEYALLNDHLIQWYRHMSLLPGVKITTGMLRAKALQIAPKLGYKDFKASNGWIASFKTNHDLKFSRPKVMPNTDASSASLQEDNDDDDDFFEDVDVDETRDLATDHQHESHNAANDGDVESSALSHLGATGRTDSNTDSVSHHHHHQLASGSGASSNIQISNTSLLSSSGSLPKVPQMGQMSLGPNFAYSLARDHRGEVTAPRGEMPSLGELHHPSIPSTVPINHTISKDTSSLNYKADEPISYGSYDSQRMNETGRAEGYNYTHYGYPGAFYGYHFLGQY